MFRQRSAQPASGNKRKQDDTHSGKQTKKMDARPTAKQVSALESVAWSNFTFTLLACVKSAFR
eukprot:m.80108 g.80108  ORF g.80108 m.80108 type:complete len:63 (+) comp36169_c0_seq2:195-383(+)